MFFFGEVGKERNEREREKKSLRLLSGNEKEDTSISFEKKGKEFEF